MFKFEVIDYVNSYAFNHLKKQYHNFWVDNVDELDLLIHLVKKDKGMKEYGSKIAKWAVRIRRKYNYDEVFIYSNLAGSRFLKKYIIESMMFKKINIPFLHASAIAGKKAFVFAGRSASGKTACAMGMHFLSGDVSYMSDDWVLLKDKKVLPYTFPIALHHQHLDLFKEMPFLSKHISFRDKLAIRGFQILEPLTMNYLKVPYDITLKQDNPKPKKIGCVSITKRDFSKNYITIEEAEEKKFLEDLAWITLKEFDFPLEEKELPKPKLKVLERQFKSEFKGAKKLVINFPFRLIHPIGSFKVLAEELERYYL